MTPLFLRDELLGTLDCTIATAAQFVIIPIIGPAAFSHLRLRVVALRGGRKGLALEAEDLGLVRRLPSFRPSFAINSSPDA